MLNVNIMLYINVVFLSDIKRAVAASVEYHSTSGKDILHLNINRLVIATQYNCQSSLQDVFNKVPPHEVLYFLSHLNYLFDYLYVQLFLYFILLFLGNVYCLSYLSVSLNINYHYSYPMWLAIC